METFDRRFSVYSAQRQKLIRYHLDMLARSLLPTPQEKFLFWGLQHIQPKLLDMCAKSF